MAADALEATSHGYNGYVFDHDMRRHDFVGHRVDCINAYAIDYIHMCYRAGIITGNGFLIWWWLLPCFSVAG